MLRARMVEDLAKLATKPTARQLNAEARELLSMARPVGHNPNTLTLGDTAVVMGNSKDIDLRTPKVEGIVIMVARSSVKLRVKRRFLFWSWHEEEWYTIKHFCYHVEKVRDV